MKCTSPLTAYRLSSGDVFFVERGDVIEQLDLPCGKCISCRLNRSEEWATRIMHEAKEHDSNCFVTLTYDDHHLPSPPSLNHKHFQLFMRYLRRKYPGVRYFMCGEYGENTKRPHYHAALFGIDFLHDRKHCGGMEERAIYNSATLSALWPYGHSVIGSLTRESASYISRYIVQKKFVSRFSPPEIRDYYKMLDFSTGEIIDRQPEYIRMSLKPGIGNSYYVKYGHELYPHDAVIVDGRETRIPRYYDKLQKRKDFYVIDDVKMTRRSRAKEHVEDNSDVALKMQDEWLKHSLSQTKSRHKVDF